MKGEYMCFTKSSPTIVAPVEPQDPVIRQEASAALTKTSKNDNNFQGYRENIKTSAIGLEDNANTKKKTLLGE